MKARVALAFLMLATIAVAQQQEQQPADGVIHGMVIGQDGLPAKGIGLTACPLGVALGAVLPHTKTNDKGEYRFQHIPWWGRYTVYANDEDAGYSDYSTGAAGKPHPPEVELTPEHPEAELNVQLPPKAGFVEIHLTNRTTGASIHAMEVVVVEAENPESLVFSMSCASDRTVLVPPDRDLLLHVTSNGFREWDGSVGNGKPIHVTSGTRLILGVELVPSK